MNERRRNIAMLLILLALVFDLIGGTLAYWTWYSSENKSVVFNTAGNVSDYIVYDEGSSHFVGDFMPTNTYCQAVNTTVSFYKTEDASDIELRATINMDVNAIGSNIAESSDVYWVVTKSDSNISCEDGLNGSSVLGSGTFFGKTAGETIQLVKDIEVTTTEEKYTVWIWLDSNGTGLSKLSGETVDTNVWTQIDMVDPDYDNNIENNDNTYTVTYNVNGGTNGPSNESNNIGESVTISSTVPTRTGYTFSGWNTIANGSGTSYSAGTTYSESENIILYAVWTPNTYTISYNAGIGSGTMESTTCSYDKNCTLRTNEFIKDGYTFIGWSTSSDGTEVVYNNGQTIVYNQTSDMTLYALWEAGTYTISYDSGLGAGGPTSQSKKYGETITLSLDKPTRNNYYLVSWNTSSDGSGTNYQPGDSYNKDESVTLYAIWALKTSAVCPTITDYNGSYDGNAHSITVSGGSGGTIKYSTDNSNWNETLPTITNAGSLTTYVMVEGDDAHNSVTCGSKTATISKAENPINVVVKEDLVYSGTELALVTTSNAQGDVYYSTTEQLTSSNYSTSGSTITPTGSCDNEFGNTYTIYYYTPGNTNYKLKSGTVSNIKVTCQTYTISYDANGGAGSPESQTKYYGISQTLSNIIPTKEGYTFIGWSTDVSATSATYSAGENYTSNEDITLYATWEGNNYAITFNPNGGSFESTTFTTVGETEYTVSSDGAYKIEVWGASGGDSYGMKNGTVHKGGYGGYSVGKVTLSQNSKLYVNVGGQGTTTYQTLVNVAGGYNGGGTVVADLSYDWYTGHGGGTGGGATHIATISGELSSLESYKGSLYEDGSAYNSSNILIVAGGGGGGGDFYYTSNGVTRYAEGGSGGGYVGGALVNSYQQWCDNLSVSTQTSAGATSGGAGAFGLGGTSSSGGGGGFYGGGSCNGGTGGTGYIGSSLLTDKYMYCYNCETIDSEHIKTYTTTNVSSTPTSNYAKTGNGAAKITKINEIKKVTNGIAYGELPIPEKTDYIFVGWNTKADGTGTTIASDSIVNINNDTTLYAIWKVSVVNVTFDANGGIIETTSFTTVGQNTYNVPSNGTYKLEVWGASGGDSYGMKNGTVHKGGYGGYSVGKVTLSQNSKLYVNVGGQGTTTYQTSVNVSGGYNGGGSVVADLTWGSGHGEGTGGGATHIATISGQLSTLESYKGTLYEDGSTYNSSKILIVAGGGGGGGDFYWADNGTTRYAEGGSGGGYIGGALVNSYAQWCDNLSVSTQTSAGATSGGAGTFGLGGSSSAGGGGGFYGGGSCTGGTGGTGYIGSSLLTDKYMYCYNCETTDSEHIKTYTTTNVSAAPISNYVKTGNGAAKISKLSESKKATNGMTYGTLPTPTKDGYTFVGWNTKADGTGSTITSASIVNLSGATTLYAMWDLGPYTINYNLLYGLNDVSTTTSDYMNYSVSNGVVTVTATSDDGYGFVNGRVYLEQGVEYTFSATSSGTWSHDESIDTVEAYLMLNGEYSTYYHMETNNYTFTPTVSGEYWLRLDVNQSGKTHTFSDIMIYSSDLSPQTKTYGNTLTLSNTIPVRKGYDFLGWSTDPLATSATYASGGSYTVNNNTTLYAVWKSNSYTVSYNANGGSGAPSAQTKYHDTTLTLSSTTPTRSGYIFAGWSTSSSATSATYKAGGSYTANASVTLYAVWTTVTTTSGSFTYNITYQYGTFWSDGTVYTVVPYSISYNPVTNQSTVTFGQLTCRTWASSKTETTESIYITVTATDSGNSASSSTSTSDYRNSNNSGFGLTYPTPSPTSVTVQHSNTTGAKSVTISSSASMTFYADGYGDAYGSGSKTHSVGTYSG